MSMSSAEKLDMVKTILRIDDNSEDALLDTYLTMAAKELLSWRYSHAAVIPHVVPDEYEMTQIQAVVNGYTQSGTEGQVLSVENGIHRHFKHSDMVDYIRNSVVPFVRVPGTGGGTA